MIEEKPRKVLLQQKKAKMLALLRVTEDGMPVGKDLEKDGERYVRLVEEREKIIEGLKALDLKIEALSIDSSAPLSQEEAELLQEIRETAARVIARERENRKQTPEIMRHIQEKIREINHQKRVSTLYNRGNPFEKGRYMDKKN